MRRMLVLWLAGCGSAESPSDRTAGLDGITSDADCDAPVVRYYDADGDGHGDPAMPVALCADVEGFVDNDDDCDILRPDVSPSATEICGDLLDNDCDGADLACVAPELATDGISYRTDSPTFGFAALMAGPIDLDGDGALEVLTGDPKARSGRGHALLLEMPDAPLGGEEYALTDPGAPVYFAIEGDADNELGSTLAAVWLDPVATYPDTAAMGVVGPINIGGIDLQTAIYLFTTPQSTTTLTDADLTLYGAAGDPSLSYEGYEALGAGRWLEDSGDQGVLAASDPLTERVWVVPLGTISDGDAVTTRGVGFANLDFNNDYGAALHWADLNGDGLDDLVVGVPAYDVDEVAGIENGGGVWMLDGATIQEFASSTEPNMKDHGTLVYLNGTDIGAGRQLDAADFDGDGLPELVLGGFDENVGAPGSITLVDPDGLPETFAGTEHPHDDLPGNLRVARIHGDEAFDFFGFDVAALQRPQAMVAVGAPGREETGGEDVLGDGVWLLPMDDEVLDATSESVSASTDFFLETDEPADGLGLGLHPAGDVDGDDEDELWISAPGVTAGGRAVLMLRTSL